MLRFDRILQVFDDILRQDPLYEVVSTSHGYTLLGWEPNREEMVQRPVAGHAGGHAGRADRCLFQLCGGKGHKWRPGFDRAGAARAGRPVSRAAGEVLAGQIAIAKRRVSNALRSRRKKNERSTRFGCPLIFCYSALS